MLPAGDLPQFTDSHLLFCCVAVIKCALDAEGHSTDTVGRGALEPKASVSSTSIAFIESIRELLLCLLGIGGDEGHLTIVLPAGTLRHLPGFDGLGLRQRGTATVPADQPGLLSDLLACLVRVCLCVAGGRALNLGGQQGMCMLPAALLAVPTEPQFVCSAGHHPGPGGRQGGDGAAARRQDGAHHGARPGERRPHRCMLLRTLMPTLAACCQSTC